MLLRISALKSNTSYNLLSTSAWSNYPAHSLASVRDVQGHDSVKCVTGNLMIQDHKTLKGGLPVSAHSTLCVCAFFHIPVGT